jgi:hypothetical protein
MLELKNSQNYSIKQKIESELSHKIQKDLAKLQQPKNCSIIKKLFGLAPVCGFGCRMHHIILYAYTAYHFERTFYIQNAADFDTYYARVSSDACFETEPNRTEFWKSLYFAL